MSAKVFLPEMHTLSNGIPVAFQHYDGAVAATYWWVQTGSADENPREAGFAHFLEHMLFKDAGAKETGQASTGQMARAIESLGGEINAYTSFDQTVYHVTCAAHQWERVIDVFGTMAKPQKFLRSDFEREREVILEELRKNQDSPSRRLFQGLFSSTFARHPYGRPVIGFERTLNAANVQMLEAFYKRQYISGRMGLVLAGPIGTTPNSPRVKSILKLLEKRFGKSVIKPKAAPAEGRAPTRPVEPALRPRATPFIQPFDVKTPTLAFSFRVPDIKHPDVPALDIAAGVLSMGELSRLYQRLFYTSSIATDVSGGMYVPNDPGMIYLQAEFDDLAKTREVAAQMLDEIARLRDEGPTDAELERVRVNSESERLYSTQTADGMASRVGFLRFVVGDLGFDREYTDALRAVDSDRLREVMREYFTTSRMSVALLLPKDSPGANAPKDEAASRSTQSKKSAAKADPAVLKAGQGVVDAVIAQAESVLGKSARPTGARQKLRQRLANNGASITEPEFFTLDSGMQVIHRQNLASHAFSVHVASLGGLRLESNWGSSNLLALTWTKGAEDWDAKKIAALVEGRAAGMDGFSGRNTTGMQMTGLARDWSELSRLFSRVLARPTFPDAEVMHSRRVAEDSIRSLEDHSSQLCSKLFLETLYETHPYGRLTTGSLESIASIDSKTLLKQHAEWVRPERLILSVSGAVKRAELESWLKDLGREFKTGGAAARTTASDHAPGITELKGPRWVERSLGREQLHIIVGGYGSTMNAEDRLALQIMQTLLGGQSGRLFIELREKKSLAYTVAPINFEGIEPGYVGTYIACSPGKRAEALAGIRQVHETLAKKGPTAAEMARAKEFFLGRRAMELQSDSSLATHYGLEAVYGIAHRSDAEVLRRVQAITPKQIQAICRRYLVEPNLVTSVVG